MGNHLFLSGTVFAAGFLSFFAPCTFRSTSAYSLIGSKSTGEYSLEATALTPAEF